MYLKNTQAQKLAEYKAKRAKTLAEYNHYLTFRAHPERITKINYRIDKVTRDATIRIERDNQPLSLIVIEKFRLKQLGFTEWIEIQALASKGKSKATDTLLKSLKAKFEWVKAQAGKLGLSPPPELTEDRLTPAERKRKRTSKMIKEVFRESGFYITITVQLIRLLKHINQDSPEAREMYKIMEIEIECRGDVNKAREIVRTNLDGMGIDV
ncbi:hypothetical protein Tco_0545812 [Tanacetum coccineum]